MNCLVLGGNGFIGSHLVDKLLNEKHQVRVFDKYEERYRPPVPCVQYCYGDFGNRGVLAEALLDTDIVFHLISTTTPKTSNDDPEFDIQSNLIERTRSWTYDLALNPQRQIAKKNTIGRRLL